MTRFRPTLADYFPLDDEHVRTEYLKRKAARLATEPVNDHRRVIYREHLSTLTVKHFSVWGLSQSTPYGVCVLPHTDPWMAACSRGGIHDLQPPGACSHGVAAAAVWKLLTEREEVEEGRCPPDLGEVERSASASRSVARDASAPVRGSSPPGGGSVLMSSARATEVVLQGLARPSLHPEPARRGCPRTAPRLQLNPIAGLVVAVNPAILHERQCDV